jgi:hypothetical protein
MSLAAVWEFIAGDSKRAPVAVVLAIAVAVGLLHGGISGPLVAAAFAAIIAMGLAASVFEP